MQAPIPATCDGDAAMERERDRENEREKKSADNTLYTATQAPDGTDKNRCGLHQSPVSAQTRELRQQYRRKLHTLGLKRNGRQASVRPHTDEPCRKTAVAQKYTTLKVNLQRGDDHEKRSNLSNRKQTTHNQNGRTRKVANSKKPIDFTDTQRHEHAGLPDTRQNNDLHENVILCA